VADGPPDGPTGEASSDAAAGTDTSVAGAAVPDAAPEDAAIGGDVAPDAAPDADPWWSDPSQACARIPADLDKGPSDLLQRAAHFHTLVLGKVLRSPSGTIAPNSPQLRTVDMTVEDAFVRIAPGQAIPETPVIGGVMVVEVSDQAVPAIGSRAYFYVIRHYRADLSDTARVYLEPKASWRVDPVAYPGFAETARAAAAYVQARPIFTDTIVDARTIVEATVTALGPKHPWHCSTSDYRAVVRVERTLCGGATGEIAVYAPPHAYQGCAGASDEGRQPQLAVAQRVVLVLRAAERWEFYVPAGHLVLWNESDARPLTAWNELAELRMTAAR
jgi:hypothetical protein